MSHLHIYCLSHTNIQRSKNHFTRVRTTEAVVRVKQSNLNSIKRETLAVHIVFYFLMPLYNIRKKFLSFQNPYFFLYFSNLNAFFCSSNI